ncbi:MAG: recombinase family protein [Rhodanobacteraceae bacterium]|nr:recombinase family protein [Rhodanobacteraceae bacterium]
MRRGHHDEGGRPRRGASSGRSIHKVTLTSVLKNRVYLGELWSRERVLGTHEPIIDQALWDRAQAEFTVVNPQRRANLMPARREPPIR